MKKIDSYWISLAVIVIGLGLIWFTVNPGSLHGGDRFVMTMLLVIAKVVAGAGLVTVGLIVLLELFSHKRASLREDISCFVVVKVGEFPSAGALFDIPRHPVGASSRGVVAYLFADQQTTHRHCQRWRTLFFPRSVSFVKKNVATKHNVT